jgi:DeoR family lactose phosphotransferase system repressor
VLKEERYQKILKLIEKDNIIKIADISKVLDVTEMTVRRDLKYLEMQKLLTRIHGGAKKRNEVLFKELSNNEKRKINIDEKKYVAKLAAKLIHENDIIYIGPGTTNELICDYIDVSYAKVITNSMSIFKKLKDDTRFELILTGGRYRSRTDVFVGNFTNEILENIRVKAAFVGVNGICNNNITTSSEEEGVCQRIILDNASERYIVCDSSKINKEDFYSFYNLNDTTAMITDNKIEQDIIKKYEVITKIINK